MKILSIDIGGSSIKYAIFDESLTKLKSGKVKTPLDTLDHLYSVLDRIISKDIDGIAISMPGIIDSKNGIALTGGALMYIDHEPIVEKLNKKYHLPVWVGNDAKCAALAEVGYGSLVDVEDAFVIILGTGIGGCMIKDRKVHMGKRFSAGEVSSLITKNDAPFDYHNFWWNVSGIQGLLRTIQKYLDTDVTYSGEEIFEMANRKNEKVLAALDEFCFKIATQLFNIQVITDPEKIAIGGGISCQPILIQKINEQYQKLCNPVFTPIQPVDIVACKFNNDANLIGAYYQLIVKIQENE